MASTGIDQKSNQDKPQNAQGVVLLCGLEDVLLSATTLSINPNDPDYNNKIQKSILHEARILDLWQNILENDGEIQISPINEPIHRSHSQLFVSAVPPLIEYLKNKLRERNVSEDKLKKISQNNPNFLGTKPSGIDIQNRDKVLVLEADTKISFYQDPRQQAQFPQFKGIQTQTVPTRFVSKENLSHFVEAQAKLLAIGGITPENYVQALVNLNKIKKQDKGEAERELLSSKTAIGFAREADFPEASKKGLFEIVVKDPSGFGVQAFLVKADSSGVKLLSKEDPNQILQSFPGQNLSDFEPVYKKAAEILRQERDKTWEARLNGIFNGPAPVMSFSEAEDKLKDAKMNKEIGAYQRRQTKNPRIGSYNLAVVIKNPQRNNNVEIANIVVYPAFSAADQRIKVECTDPEIPELNRVYDNFDAFINAVKKLDVKAEAQIQETPVAAAKEFKQAAERSAETKMTAAAQAAQVQVPQIQAQVQVPQIQAQVQVPQAEKAQTPQAAQKAAPSPPPSPLLISTPAKVASQRKSLTPQEKLLEEIQQSTLTEGKLSKLIQYGASIQPEKEKSEKLNPFIEAIRAGNSNVVDILYKKAEEMNKAANPKTLNPNMNPGSYVPLSMRHQNKGFEKIPATMEYAIMKVEQTSALADSHQQNAAYKLSEAQKICGSVYQSLTKEQQKQTDDYLKKQHPNLKLEQYLKPGPEKPKGIFSRFKG